MELKGIISRGENIGLTCCTYVSDILIGGVSLYGELEKLFDQDTQEYFDDYDRTKKSPQHGVKYVILDTPPEADKTFEQQSAEVVTQMMFAEYVSGCYSEWTCGYGGFDYAINEDGHSIFNELGIYIGKYIHFKI